MLRTPEAKATRHVHQARGRPPAMKSELGDCTMDGCGRRATRRTPWGDLCEGHRKRTIPSRAGGKKLFESIAKREEFLRRFRDVALEYGNATEDAEFDAAERKLLALLQSVAGDSSPEVAKAAAELAEARSLAIRRGIARHRAGGKPWGRRRSFTDEQLQAAVEQTNGNASAAARILGRPPRAVQRAMRQLPGYSSHGRMHTMGGKPSVPEQEQSEVHQGAVHAAEAREEQGRLRAERQDGAGGRTPSGAGVGNRLLDPAPSRAGQTGAPSGDEPEVNESPKGAEVVDRRGAVAGTEEEPC